MAKATAKDPTAYELAKTALLGAQVTCPCGESITNTKSARASHRARNKIHLAWLAGGCTAAASDAALSLFSEPAPAEAGAADDADAQADDGDWECGSSDEEGEIPGEGFPWPGQGGPVSEDVQLSHGEPQDDSGTSFAPILGTGKRSNHRYAKEATMKLCISASHTAPFSWPYVLRWLIHCVPTDEP